MRIKVGETPYNTIGVDTPEDLERVERCLSISS
jgi:CMP-2-keto-3-deoxyoctulosonic acid synthetase